MFKAFLDSIVWAPALLGVVAALLSRGRQRVLVLLALHIFYGIVYIMVIYILSHRWLG